MPYASDGTPHHSFSRAKNHEAGIKPKPAMEKKPVEEKQPEHEDAGGDSIENVVKTHGPAHHMEYHRDEATGKHHVKSKHGETEHDSEHESPEEAHKHMSKAMGQDPEAEDEETGEIAGEVMPEMEEETAGHIPGLR